MCVMLSIIMPSVTIAQNWPILQGDIQRTSFFDFDFSDTNNILWSYQASGEIISSPVIFEDKIYFGTINTKKLICLDNYGNLEWQYQVAGKIQSTPTLSGDKVIFTCRDGNIYCLDANSGTEEWIFNTGQWSDSSPLIINNLVYVVAYDQDFLGKLYCLYLESGNEKWSYPGVSIISSPSYFNDNIYVGSDDNKILSIDADDGELNWEKHLGELELPIGAPSISNNFLFIGSGGFTMTPTIFCLDLQNSGYIEWQYDLTDLGTAVSTSISVDNNNLYFGVSNYPNGILVCLDKNSGQYQWKYTTNGEIQSSPTITQNRIYFGSNDDNLYCLRSTDGSLVWSYDTGNDVACSPAISDNKLYISTRQDSKILCFGENNAPPIPNKPIGISEGIVDTDYEFTIGQVEDPDGDEIYYKFNWDDGTNSGWLESPLATHKWSNSGTFNVKAKTKDVFGTESDWSEIKAVQITGDNPYVPQLNIDCVNSVDESQEFTISITADEQPIEDADIIFNENTYKTDENGQKILTAPEVSSNQILTITAQKEGYEQVGFSITIKNKVTVDNGYIYGNIYSDSNPIKSAKICAYISEKKYRCVYSDENGQYLLPISEGNYNLKIEKEGYETNNVNDVIVSKNKATEKSIELESKSKPETTNSNSKFIEHTIVEKVNEEKVGAQINVKSSDQSVLYYSNNYEIEIQKIQDEVSFSISAEEGTSSTILVVNIDEKVLTNLNNLEVKYDGGKIEEFTDIEEFFNIDENSELGWIQLSTKTETFVFVRVPHFSEHTITITSVAQDVIQFLGGPESAVIYSMIFLFGSLVFIIPVVYDTLFIKKKK